MQRWERTQKGFRFGNHFPLFCVVAYWSLLWHFRRAHKSITSNFFKIFSFVIIYSFLECIRIWPFCRMFFSPFRLCLHFFSKRLFGQCVWDGGWESVSSQFQTSFRPLCLFWAWHWAISASNIWLSTGVPKWAFWKSKTSRWIEET